MGQFLNLNNKKDLDFHFINEKLINFGNILKKNEIYNENEFKNWFNDFKKIYGNKHVTIQLYIVFALLYFIGYSFISKFILLDNNLFSNHRYTLKRLIKVERKLESIYKNLKIFDLKYFKPLISLVEKEEISIFYELIELVSNSVFKSKIEPEYFFDYLIQKLISPNIRHKSGEYYTPSFLVKKMVNDSYSFGDYTLDPCCGSGNFLIEVINYILSQNRSKKEKIEAINKVYGFDINPISIYISKINFLYLLKNLENAFLLNLYVFDSLFQKRENFNDKFDLIIGNPPWYTYRDIESLDYQEKVKNLAEELEIKPLPKNILNLEISTLFFVRVMKTFLKNDAKIFFVITKGVITGSHASRFRNFRGVSNLRIWMFDNHIKKIFNIDFICLFGQKSEGLKKSNEEFKSYYFTLRKEKSNLDYFDSANLELENVDILIPYSIEKKGGKTYVKKLISKESIKNLTPLKESYYKKLFHKGADLNPRNLIFVRFNKFDDSLVRINPDNRIFKRAKSPWNKIEFKNEIIEKKFLFKVIKSTELVKFLIYDHYNVFLPLLKSDLSFNYEKLANYAKKFYDKINTLYLKYKKTTTKHNSLMENMNRWSKLINQRQLSKIKVVYNNSGSILNSSVIQGNFLITGDLSFYDSDNLCEAYYLSAILNSNVMTNNIKIMKSSRHIFKIPLDIPIKKFNEKSQNHSKLAELGKNGQETAKSTVSALLEKNKNNLSKFKIQNILRKKLTRILTQIDEILRKELRSS